MTDRLTNPKIVGPGVWFSIHLLAKQSVDHSGKQKFIDYMEDLSENFPCMKCQEHIKEYLAENPFDPFMNLVNEHDEDIGMFKWSWMFHNTVNARLTKPILDWDTVKSMYYNEDDMICSQDCDESINIINNMNNDNDDNIIIEYTNTNNTSYDAYDDTYKPQSTKVMNQRSFKKVGINKADIIQGYFLTKGISEMANKI